MDEFARCADLTASVDCWGCHEHKVLFAIHSLQPAWRHAWHQSLSFHRRVSNVFVSYAGAATTPCGLSTSKTERDNKGEKKAKGSGLSSITMRKKYRACCIRRKEVADAWSDSSMQAAS